ncbi:hypothetical protein [Kitasatospora sp. NPDC059571]|uniref:hypothetical protein n=1 Tax=Kitasatospora sp. NPDC059571 TaxID=3346871 RepID=UPI0036751D59
MTATPPPDDDPASGPPTAAPLPAEVAAVLDAVLGRDGEVRAALRRQIPHLGVRARCGCGCGTAYFDLDTGSVQPAPVAGGTRVAAEALLYTESGDCPGEVLVFTHDGFLSWLEVCSWSDDVEVTMTAAARWLALPGDRTVPVRGAV